MQYVYQASGILTNYNEIDWREIMCKEDEYKGFAVSIPEDELETVLGEIFDHPLPVPPGGWPDDQVCDGDGEEVIE